MSIEVNVIRVDPFICSYSGLFEQSEIDKINSQIPFDVFEPSMGFNYETQSNDITEYRTSNTFFDDGRLKWVRQRMYDFISNRFWWIKNHNIECSEQIQCQRYKPGQEYKSHFDYFNQFGMPETTPNDRIATMILYLNDDFTGGKTTFDNLGIEFTPIKGTCLYFEYRYMPEMNVFTLHAGQPVETGEKRILTLWVRKEAISHD